MQANTAGQRILNGTVNASNFAGLPLVGACVNLSAPNRATAVSNLFTYADSIGAPAIATDDTDSLDSLIQPLIFNGKFCVPGSTANPWLFANDAIVTTGKPPCGPIFSLDLIEDNTKAPLVAAATVNLRRNHKFKMGCNAIYPFPTSGNYDGLDIDQYPPIYLPDITTFKPNGSGGVIGTDHSIFQPLDGYFYILDQCWTAPQAFLWSAFAGRPASVKEISIQGLTVLATKTATYHNIDRHIAPWLVPLIAIP